jgi:hypothetical protein
VHKGLAGEGDNIGESTYRAPDSEYEEEERNSSIQSLTIFRVPKIYQTQIVPINKTVSRAPEQANRV